MMSNLEYCSSCGEIVSSRWLIVSGKPLCHSCDRLKREELSALPPPVIDMRDTEIPALKARIAEFEAQQVDEQAALARLMSTYNAILTNRKRDVEHARTQGWADGIIWIMGVLHPTPDAVDDGHELKGEA